MSQGAESAHVILGGCLYEVMRFFGAGAPLEPAQISQVAVDSRGFVHVLRRGAPPVAVFMPGGEFAYGYGAGEIFDPHGIAIDAHDRLIYLHNGGMFMAGKPIDGQPASQANGGTIGFTMSGPEQTDAWHAAGVNTGGVTCEDLPGVRSTDFGDMYLAYLRDPDGNKLCGLYAMPKA